jgi:hypothetical protein
LPVTLLFRSVSGDTGPPKRTPFQWNSTMCHSVSLRDTITGWLTITPCG